jgi:hypothetical protein
MPKNANVSVFWARASTKEKGECAKKDDEQSGKANADSNLHILQGIYAQLYAVVLCGKKRSA